MEQNEIMGLVLLVGWLLCRDCALRKSILGKSINYALAYSAIAEYRGHIGLGFHPGPVVVNLW